MKLQENSYKGSNDDMQRITYRMFRQNTVVKDCTVLDMNKYHHKLLTMWKTHMAVNIFMWCLLPKDST